MSGALIKDEQLMFEQALLSDPELKAAVENYETGKKLSEGLLEIDMLGTIARLESKSKKTQKKKSIKTLIGWLLLLLVSIGLLYMFYINYKTEQENKQWYAEVYEKPIDPDATKSIDTTGMDLLQKGKFFFALNDFQQSESILRQLKESTTDQDTLKQANIWLGHALIGQGKWEGREMIE